MNFSGFVWLSLDSMTFMGLGNIQGWLVGLSALGLSCHKAGESIRYLWEWDWARVVFFCCCSFASCPSFKLREAWPGGVGSRMYWASVRLLAWPILRNHLESAFPTYSHSNSETLLSEEGLVSASAVRLRSKGLLNQIMGQSWCCIEFRMIS